LKSRLARALLTICLTCLATVTVSAQDEGQDEGQLKRGRLLFLYCQACHYITPSSVQKVGPNLHGLMGNAAATAPGYESYSDDLRNSGIVWTTETLNQFLKQPTAMVPGTTMAVFAGMASDADRNALVYFMEKFAGVSTCVSCHGADGISKGDLWPDLAGQNASYMAKQLRAFRDGSREDPMMNPLSEMLSDQDINDVVVYFSELK
jgi:cytochrome c2